VSLEVRFLVPLRRADVNCKRPGIRGRLVVRHFKLLFDEMPASRVQTSQE